MVQISVPSTSSSGTGTVLTVSSQLPFLMDIQRQDMGATQAVGAATSLYGPITGLVRSSIGADNQYDGRPWC